MNQATYQSYLAAITAGDAANQAILQRLRVIWQKARDLYIDRYEENAISDFFEWIERRRPHSIWASIMRYGQVRSYVIKGDTITITVSDTFRSETDYEDYSIPLAWLLSEDINAMLTTDLDKLHADFEAHQKAEQETEQCEHEQADRAEYDRLKEHFAT